MAANAPTPLQRLVLAFYAFFAILFRADVATAVQRLREQRRAGQPAALEGGTATTPSSSPTLATPVQAAAPIPIPTATRAATAAATPTATATSTSTATSTPSATATPSATPSATATPAASPQRAPAISAGSVEALHLLSVLQREGRLVDFIEEDLTGFPDAAVGAAARTVHEGCRRAIAELFRIEPVLRDAEGAQVTVERGFDPAAIRLTGGVVGDPPFRGALRHHGWRALEVKLPPPAQGVDPRILAPAEVELP
jgi:uncharacterized protein DUF2760